MLNKKSFGILLAAAGLLASSTSALAHHAFAAEFDAEKPVDIKGTLTKVRLVNPHSWVYFDVKNADGSITPWAVEFGAPNALESRGLTKADLKVGEEIRIQGYRAKNGGPFGYSVTAILSDGRSFRTGGAQDAPAPAAQ